MSIPYTSGDFTLVRVVDHSIKYPFHEFGDNTAKIYTLECEVNLVNYSPLVVGTANLTNATTAGVIELPAGFANASARYCHDTEPVSLSGGVCRFQRVFATVPGTHNQYGSIVVDLPKAYDDGTNDEIFRGGATSIAARFAHQFNTVIGSLTISQPFVITYDDLAVNWVRDAPNASTPTKTQFYSSTERVAEPTQVTRWMGDIYMGVTSYIKPEDAY